MRALHNTWVPVLLLLLWLAVPLPGQEPGQGEDSRERGSAPGEPKPEDPPRVKASAWVALGDESTVELPRGLDVPMAVLVDNPFETIETELRVSTQLGMGLPGGGMERQLTFSTRRRIEVPEASQRMFEVSLHVPASARFISLDAFLGSTRIDTQRLYWGVDMASSVQLMVLGPGPKLFARGDDEPDPVTPWGDRLDLLELYPSSRSLPARPVAYDSVDGILVLGRGADPARFPEAHQQAVLDAVLGGTTLLLAPGDSPELFERGPFASVLPVRHEGIATVHLPEEEPARGLGAVGRPTELPRFRGESVPGLKAQALPGRTVKMWDPTTGAPLLVEGRHGLGRVLWLGFDPAAVPAPGRLRLQELLFESRRDPLRGSLRSLRERPSSDISFDLKAPPRSEILSFLGLYIVLLVPGTFLIASLFGRREVAWVLMPLLSLGFAFYYYQAGFLSQQGYMSTAEAGVMVLASGEGEASRARIAGKLLLYSPRSWQGLEISCDQPDVAFGLDPEEFREEASRGFATERLRQDEGGRVLEGFSIKAKSLRGLVYDGAIDVSGSVLVEVEDLGSGQRRVTLHNRLDGVSLHGRERSVADPERPDGKVRVTEAIALEVLAGDRLEMRQRIPFDEVLELPPGESVSRLLTLRELHEQGLDQARPGFLGTRAILVGAVRAPFLQVRVGGELKASTDSRYSLIVPVW